ncbi:MarR family winged helix-turn-helix transcriptional regulator [Paenibacillus tyrfis]|uniref:MarR family winged helix-turn-helix transcriptional regulator n=1 Tax=Paenibacillus tyrfis TaxID=1501230 RepID=UPI0020A1E2CA|nr:MarR family transcriptional regulator [Paenibacillus tyrfis]MCP1310632.1 MarR family transcriptional regulator [Paenibacillus tyrfis]
MQDLQAYVLNPPLPTQAFFALVDATADLVGASERYWNSKGLHGARMRVLVETSKEGGTILPSLLARRIGVTKPNISILLTPLEHDGYIRRSGHPEDGRKTVISITEEGRELLQRYLPGNREEIAERMKGLEEQELKQFISLLNKLKTHA